MFENKQIQTTGVDIYDYPTVSGKEADEILKIITKVCNGNFILNLNTGEYKSSLTKIQYDSELKTLKINIKK